MNALATETLDEVDPTFREDLAHSQEAARATGDWLLANHGLRTTIPEIKCRPSVGERFAYSDGGDVIVHLSGQQTVICEAKRRFNITFSSAKDYPYPTILVDVCHALDAKEPKPYGYFIWNRDLTAFALVKLRTMPKWKRERRMNRGRERDQYYAPLNCVEFYQAKEVTP